MFLLGILIVLIFINFLSSGSKVKQIDFEYFSNYLWLNTWGHSAYQTQVFYLFIS